VSSENSSMGKAVANNFAAGTPAKAGRKKAYEGRHISAHDELKQQLNAVPTIVKFPKNRRNRKKPKRANIIALPLDEIVISKLEKNWELYYVDPKGIDMTYPEGSSQRNLNDLQIITDNKNDNNFNVCLGHKKKQGRVNLCGTKGI
jgi:hypothetical protein